MYKILQDKEFCYLPNERKYQCFFFIATHLPLNVKCSALATADVMYIIKC